MLLNPMYNGDLMVLTPNDTIHIVSMEFLTNNSLLLHTSNGFIYNCC